MYKQIMKKFLYVAAMTLLLASCTEDFKDWAEPQSNPQESPITFGNGTATAADVIDYGLLPTGTTEVKVCNLTVPSCTDTNYNAESFIVFEDGFTTVLNNDGTMDAVALNDYVVSLFGRGADQRDMTARVKWVMTDGTTAVTSYSEPFTVSVILAPVLIPDLWYLVGACIGDGSWTNTPEAVGTSLIPMYGTPGNVTVLTYVGYFPARKGFKIIHTPGMWDEQYSTIDDQVVKNTGDGGNIKFDEAGYYMIQIDTDVETVTITKYDGVVAGVYDMMSMPGGYQGWDVTTNLMTPMNTRYENHDWISKDMTFTEATELKFAANGSWDVNWGNPDAFPLGIGTQGGNNIQVPAGTYTVFFNDILGEYYFMAQ